MSLMIDRLNSLPVAIELNNTDVEIIDGLFNVQNNGSGTAIAQVEDQQSKNRSIDAKGNLKMKDQSNVGQSTLHIPKPSNLAGISTSDFAELRNYIYGVNGRY
jgi:CRP/FNR family transcriptional regulator, cyclic AMP receptor protein